MTNKNDLRYQKTEMQIRDAFLSLLKDKAVSSITINDIARAAMINRSTFYAHYLDKYDWLEKYTARCLARLKDLPVFDYSKSRSKPTKDQLQNLFERLFTVIGEDAVFYKRMFLEFPDFNQQLENTLRHLIMERLVLLRKNNRNETVNGRQMLTEELMARYFSNACIGVIRWWLNNDMFCTPQEISHLFCTISTNTVYSIYGLET